MTLFLRALVGITLVFLLNKTTAFNNTGSFSDNLAFLCGANGFRYTIITGDIDGSSSLALSKAFSDRQLSYSMLNFNAAICKVDMNQDSVVILVSKGSIDKVDDFLKIIPHARIGRTVIGFTDKLSLAEEQTVFQTLHNFSTNGLFYLMYFSANNARLKVKEVITLNNLKKAVINDVQLSKAGKIRSPFNLQGAQLAAIVLPWAPYISMDNCFPDTSPGECQRHGLLVDMMDQMCQILNCTWTVVAPRDGNWGVRPDSGPFNRSGEWSGVLGGVVNGSYMFSLSQWVSTPKRLDILDFVSMSTDRMALALTPQPASVDIELILRPFKRTTWFAILGICVVIFLCLAVPHLILVGDNAGDESTSYKMSMTSTCYFFLIVNAFYGGALTMFFASEATLPFESIEDVMREYPAWKLKMMAGNDELYQQKAFDGDPLYKAFWDRVQFNPKEAVYNTLEEGLDELIQDGSVVIHTFYGPLKGFFKENPFRNQNLKIFGKSKPSFYNTILNYNSPLRPAFQKASWDLFEAGRTDHLSKMWEGGDPASIAEADTTVLSAGQIILVFIIIGSNVVISMLVLVFEIVKKHHYDAKKKKS